VSENSLLTSRQFEACDQLAFAELSGDFNPMHMDSQVARRTPAGACVVHGVQSMLWVLESLAERLPLKRLRALDADFAQFLYLGEAASVYLVKLTDAEARIELRVGETRISQYVLSFGEKLDVSADMPAGQEPPFDYAASRRDPLPLEWEAVAAAHGTIENFATDETTTSFYPALSVAIGGSRINTLMALTRLVGMVSPGLHSTFHRISVKLVSEQQPRLGLLFSTGRSDARFSVVTIAVRGSGLSGTVKASRRQPPTRQPLSATLRSLITESPFAGHTALVVGGSRGLGEVTAKLLGLLGVNVLITYLSGASEAQAVADDIVASGGRASTLRLDVLAPVGGQLDGLDHRPDSLYYFATQRISGRLLPAYSPELFRSFCGIYVDAFQALCLALTEARQRPLQVFYPSSIFVTEPSKGMAEYAMAKAAGEVMAADLTRFKPKIRVEVGRLPRVATDQTAGMIETEMESPAECMLPVVLKLEGYVARGTA